MSTITPFEIDIPVAEVERLERKLENIRLPQDEIVPGAGSDYGPPLSWFHRLHDKWLNDFDWPSVQTHLNRHNHFIASIKDTEHTLKIHFTNIKSPRPDAIPLLLVHGWPGSFHEFDRVVDSFASPSDASDPAFHCVVPSLPGFCFSSPPPRRGWTIADTARVFNTLMLELGYLSYVVQSGDWGSFVGRELGSKYPACKAVHFNFCPVEIDPTAMDLTPRDKFIKARAQDWLDNHLGYAVLMRSRPQTLIGIYDSPMGILSFVGEKYIEACHPSLISDPTKEWDDAILTTCSLYYFSNCVVTASLPYYEGVKHHEFGTFFQRKENYIEKPMGFTSFLYDTRPGTKRGVEDTGKLVFYNECDEGGHFAALERPDVILADCRKFFGGWYEA